jgi:Sigma 54 modulation/S30EA ribosomal protein C terminus
MVTTAQTAQIRIETHGEVPPWAVGVARAKVESAIGAAAEPILSARVMLAMAPDPAVARPVVAQATVDMNGQVIRAQATGKTAREAIGHLGTRLRARLARAARNWAAVRGTTAAGEHGEHGGWRHRSVPEHRPPYFPRPEEQRLVIRRASYSACPQPLDGAVDELDLLDYDFHLFTERSTGQDCLLTRVPGGYRLARARQDLAGQVLPPEHVTVSALPVPTLSVAAAAERLSVSQEPFVFFVDAATGHGSVLYHRYDGHYGQLVTVSERA